MVDLVMIPDELTLLKEGHETEGPDISLVEPLESDKLAVGKSPRIVLEYRGALRALAWLSLGPDGSVYWAPRRAVAGRGFVEGHRKAYLSELGREADPISDDAERKGIKLSFHPSGVINVGKARTGRPEWKTLDRPHQLCAVAWEHPSRFEVVRPRQRDIIIRFPLKESTPLFGSLNVVPSGQCAPISNAARQQVLIFRVEVLTEIRNLTVQLAVGDGLTGPWPEHTHVSWRTKGPPTSQQTPPWI